MGEFPEILEKRKQKRIKNESNLTYELMSDVNSSHEKKVGYALSRDISLGGMRITCDRFLPVNSPLKISLCLDKTQRLIKLLGTIRWIKSVYLDEKYDLGLEFMEMSQANSLALIENLYGNPSH